MDDNTMKVAAISSSAINSINSLQNELKTQDGKDIVLIAYEKSN